MAVKPIHKTRDLLHVQRLLGHKSINSTMVQTQLIEPTAGDHYHFAVAKDDAEAEPLIVKDFEYVATTPQGVMLFRKRK